MKTYPLSRNDNMNLCFQFYTIGVFILGFACMFQVVTTGDNFCYISLTVQLFLPTNSPTIYRPQYVTGNMNNPQSDQNYVTDSLATGKSRRELVSSPQPWMLTRYPISGFVITWPQMLSSTSIKVDATEKLSKNPSAD